jgi:hypothetical protein
VTSGRNTLSVAGAELPTVGVFTTTVLFPSHNKSGAEIDASIWKELSNFTVLEDPFHKTFDVG